MAVGDEVGLTEQMYQELIGRYIITIEVLTKRLVLKDQYISRLEAERSQPEKKTKKPPEGDIKFGE